MFLAWKEITYEKRHFTLIASVITLVGILVFFLTSLAFGLQLAMTQGIQTLGADNILLTESSNQSVQASMIPVDDALDLSAERSDSADTAPFGFGVLTLKNGDDQTSSTILAMDQDSFTLPKIIEGRTFQSEGEIVADESLKLNGYKLNDTIQTSQRDDPFKIVGFSTDSTYASTPVVYMSISDWQSTGVQFKNHVSGIAIRGTVNQDQLDKYKLTSQTLHEFVNEIPGVTAQNLTFGLMIGALILVSAVILGIFIYVLTLQKRRIFGVMKTQGISNQMLGWSVIWQTIILSVGGSVLAVLIVIACGFALPEAVPFTIPWLVFGAIGAIMVFCSLLGAFFSVRTATRIDPLIALK